MSTSSGWQPAEDTGIKTNTLAQYKHVGGSPIMMSTKVGPQPIIFTVRNKSCAGGVEDVILTRTKTNLKSYYGNAGWYETYAYRHEMHTSYTLRDKSATLNTKTWCEDGELKSRDAIIKRTDFSNQFITGIDNFDVVVSETEFPQASPLTLACGEWEPVDGVKIEFNNKKATKTCLNARKQK